MNKQIFSNSLLGERYTKYIHPSGLEIFIFPKQLTTFYAIFGVKYGSIHSRFTLKSNPKNEITVPDGIAHFLEHKLFANEDGSDSFERFSELGADANAYTSFNKTAYLFSATENFYESLRELIRFVTTPYFSNENVASEIGIITEEIKMYEDSPFDICYYGMLEGMYEHHSIRKNICGTAESIRQITPDLLYSCYNSFYNLNNMGLFVCGDVDEQTVLDICNDLLPSASAPFEVIYQNENEKETPCVYQAFVESKMQVAKPIFNIGIKDVDIPNDPNERQKRDVTYTILNEIIFSQAGELYSSLFERELISPSLAYTYTISNTEAYNSIAGEADDPQKVLDEIINYVEDVKIKGIEYEDFVRSKRSLYADFVKSFDHIDNIVNDLMSFSFDGAEMLSYIDIIESVSFEDVKTLLNTAFVKEKMTLSVVLPLENS